LVDPKESADTQSWCIGLIVLIAVTTGMRVAEVFGLRWSDVMYGEGLLAVRAKLKGGKMRYVPMLPELAGELRRYPAVIGEDRIFPPKQGAVSGRQRVEGSFEDLLERAGIEDFRFHDLRHTFASWYMMNGGDLYELAKILGHSNIKMTERYAKLAQGSTSPGPAARRGRCGNCWNNRRCWKRTTTCDTANILSDVRV
jgi:integrase